MCVCQIGQQHHRFDMLRVRKHIDRLYFADALAALRKKTEVARERFGIAGDVHDS